MIIIASQNQFNFGGADTLVNWATTNGKKIRAHTLGVCKVQLAGVVEAPLTAFSVALPASRMGLVHRVLVDSRELSEGRGRGERANDLHPDLCDSEPHQERRRAVRWQGVWCVIINAARLKKPS